MESYLHDAGADPDVGAPPVKLRLVLRRPQQRRLQEEIVPAHNLLSLTLVLQSTAMLHDLPSHTVLPCKLGGCCERSISRSAASQDLV